MRSKHSNWPHPIKPTFRTSLCAMLGVEYPIIVSADISTDRLRCFEPVVMASEAGSVGVLSASQLEVEELRTNIRAVRALTERPFGVDFSGCNDIPQMMVAIEERVPLVAVDLGVPSRILAAARAIGMKILGVMDAACAERDTAYGSVDMVVGPRIVRTREPTGSGLAILSKLVDAVSPKPVILSGNIEDGREIVAALALGAIGVWISAAETDAGGRSSLLRSRKGVMDVHQWNSLDTIGHAVHSLVGESIRELTRLRTGIDAKA